MQVCPREGEAGPDPVPELGDIDLDQQPASVIADALRGITTPLSDTA
jgi:hypothetical protein